jgi:membrane peptidoglycan carboxypeptidase
VRRVNVPLERVPKTVRAAFVATEDRRFYQHGGVDWRGAARALLRNVSHLDVREGFSTITMQVVRTAFFPRLAQQRSLGRKLIEVGLARRLERGLGKQRILELYLNVVEWGDGVFGAEAAARRWFGCSALNLAPAQAARLALALPNPRQRAPTVRSPVLDRRAARLVSAMERHGLIPQAAPAAPAAPGVESPAAAPGEPAAPEPVNPLVNPNAPPGPEPSTL